MALTNNPNKTKTIEKNWNREINSKFAELKRDTLLIPLTSIVANVSAEEQAAIDGFMGEFRQRVIGIFLSVPWQNKYQTQAYERGVGRTNDQIKAILGRQALISAPLIEADVAVSMGIAANINELDFLHTRANDSLEKWMTTLLADTKSILHENIGVVPADDIFQAIADRINVTTSRTRVIAATEVAQASQRAVIQQTQQLEISTDEDIDIRWITVKDSRVRHLHAGWHGKIFSSEQAARNITISPWNCRCGLKPVIKDRIPARADAKFAAERKILLANES